MGLCNLERTCTTGGRLIEKLRNAEFGADWIERQSGSLGEDFLSDLSSFSVSESCGEKDTSGELDVMWHWW